MIKFFIMLIGVPGCGKSTAAMNIMSFFPVNSVWISSDNIRREIYGDESVQTNPGRVFSIMRDRTLKSINSGNVVIYDATNIKAKDRKEILSLLPNDLTKIALTFSTPLEECIKRNNNRSRVVPEEVIKRMYNNMQQPTEEEGFTYILEVK